jgi:hypothetical protein
MAVVGTAEIILSARGRPHFFQFVKLLALLIDEQLRVANDVDKQDMGDFELDLFLDLNGHLVGRAKIT